MYDKSGGERLDTIGTVSAVRLYRSSFTTFFDNPHTGYSFTRYGWPDDLW
jgi:hypothetical protein